MYNTNKWVHTSTAYSPPPLLCAFEVLGFAVRAICGSAGMFLESPFALLILRDTDSWIEQDASRLPAQAAYRFVVTVCECVLHTRAIVHFATQLCV
jgi:hypothetical protein